MENRWIDKEK
jgi:hypothetical protein